MNQITAGKCFPSRPTLTIYVSAGRSDEMETLIGFSLDQVLAQAFNAGCEVESVYVFHHEDVVEVFTVVNDDTGEISDQIAEVELDLARKFTSLLFDFNTVARRNRPIHEFLGSGVPIWSRESCPQLLNT